MVRIAATLLATAAVIGSVAAAPIAKRAGTGQATYYDTTGTGACGWSNDNSEMVVAVNTAQYSGQHCGKQVEIKNTKNGKSIKAKVVDECPGCASESLDLSPGAFSNLGNKEDGVLPITWSYTG